MIPRLLAASLLSLGLSVFSTRAIATIPAKEINPPVAQDLRQNEKADAVDVAVTDQLLGVLAICMLITPVLGGAVYKQHLAYRKSAYNNKVESLERVWRLRSDVR